MSDNPRETATTLGTAYDPQAIERTLYETWERENYFAPQGDGAPYCVMIPPPNVTGSLHMGHAFQDTLMDALIRYHRMRGHNTLWQAGTDHAGIATQMVVERQLEAEGKSRHDLGRETFLKRVWEWKAQSGGAITRQLRRMGASLDWSRERFTMDAGLSQAVTEVFVRLHEEGLIYRGKRLVNWDPVLHTAVSDLEVVSEEESGHLWHIRYPLADGSGHLVVATTRPETMLGDAAVAVHPEDERYQRLIGKQVELPLTGRTIPVIADEYVDKEFGSGCVKVTPAHDFNDYEVWKRHKDSLALNSQPLNGLINIFDKSAKILGKDLDTKGQTIDETLQLTHDAIKTRELLPAEYQGLDRYEARKRIVADLEAAGLLAEIKPHKLMVPRGDRTGAAIEPYLTDQWYVKVAPLAEPAIKAVEDGRIKFVPENWSKTYYEWMRNIQDWCISRQIWWGHRIPAWYDEEGTFYVGRTETEVRARHNLGNRPLKQDDDVLDTWFSSALWPFSTLGWPEQTKELKTFYPTSVLVTGFDIIFFWVARMIMMGLKFTGEVPFREIYIHGLVRDAHGQKMSKSKGNILDPLDLIDGIDLETLVKKRATGLMRPQDALKIEKATRKEYPNGIPAFGTDALRFTFASLATQGRNINFDLNRIDGYRNFCNKLWNAARYVLMNTEGADCGQSYEDGAPSVLGSDHTKSRAACSAPSEKNRAQRATAPSKQSGAQRLGSPPSPACGRGNEGEGHIPPRAGEGVGMGAPLPHPHPLPSPGGRGEVGENLYFVELTVADRWIISRLQQVAAEVEAAIAVYRFDLAAQALHGFVWHEYCDWYLELSKVVLTDTSATAAQQRGTRHTLVHVLETLLRLLHPIMPFITEAIWQRVTGLTGKSGATIMLQPWPAPDPTQIDAQAIAELNWIMAVVTAVRTIRAERDISPGKLLPVWFAEGGERERAYERNQARYLKALARMESLTWLAPDAAPPPSAIALVGDMKVLVPLGALIDKKAESARLDREIDKCARELEKARMKLATASFVERAPAHVVEQERTRAHEFAQALAKLKSQRAQVAE